MSRFVAAKGILVGRDKERSGWPRQERRLRWPWRRPRQPPPPQPPPRSQLHRRECCVGVCRLQRGLWRAKCPSFQERAQAERPPAVSPATYACTVHLEMLPGCYGPREDASRQRSSPPRQARQASNQELVRQLLKVQRADGGRARRRWR